MRGAYRGGASHFNRENGGENRGCWRRITGYVAGVNWQTVISLVIVALAAAGLLWGWLRRRKFSFGRDTHCGCSAGGYSPNPNSIVFHARKGERPRIIVKSK
jgi:hypothetical protein